LRLIEGSIRGMQLRGDSRRCQPKFLESATFAYGDRRSNRCARAMLLTGKRKSAATV
jgi:hypothetical protein